MREFEAHILVVDDDKRIREFIITNEGPQIKDSFTNFEQIFSGAPHRIYSDESMPGVFKGVDSTSQNQKE